MMKTTRTATRRTDGDAPHRQTDNKNVKNTWWW